MVTLLTYVSIYPTIDIVISQRLENFSKNNQKTSSHAPYWNRTSDLIITSDTLYH